jgi:hypothetical protein
MTTFLITFLVMAVVIVIMSVGVLFGRKPVQGSCGGMNNITGLKECEICAGEPCQNEFPDRIEEPALFSTPKPAGGILPAND